jgi:hypothetical protein
MLALVLFSTLGQTCDDLVPGATAMLTRPASAALHSADAPYSHFRKAEGLQRGRKLQRQTFRYKHGFRQ